jgi:hypothetical protein
VTAADPERMLPVWTLRGEVDELLLDLGASLDEWSAAGGEQAELTIRDMRERLVGLAQHLGALQQMLGASQPEAREQSAPCGEDGLHDARRHVVDVSGDADPRRDRPRGAQQLDVARDGCRRIEHGPLA